VVSDREGRELKQSMPVTFFVRQNTTAQPQPQWRRSRCHGRATTSLQGESGPGSAELRPDPRQPRHSRCRAR
jgi:hypothetical protein